MTLELKARPSLAARPASVLGGVRLRGWTRVGLAGGFALAATPYLIALGSPLRLLPDSVTYLSLANGVRVPSSAQVYPPGYPDLLRLAGWIGLGSAWGYVALNLVLLGVAVFAVYRMCRGSLGLTAERAAFVCLAVLLVHTISQLAPAVMSDVPYFGVAMVSLLLLCSAERESGRRRAVRLGLGACVAAAAVSIRLEGLALVPALIFVALGPVRLSRWWQVGRQDRRRGVAIGASALLSLVGLAVAVIAVSPYAHHILDTWRPHGGVGSVLSHLGREARTKLMSLGELGTQVNCCRRLDTTFGPLSGAFAPLMAVLGVALIALVAIGWRSRRRVGAIEVFTLGTAGIILSYAGADPRFWIGAVPFLIVYAIFGLDRLARFRWARGAIALYAVAFVLIGAGWLVDGVNLSTSGRDFPRLWARQFPELYGTYSVAFGEGLPSGHHRVQPVTLGLLRRYEPLARKAGGSR